MKVLDYQTVKNKLANGMSLVEVWEEWMASGTKDASEQRESRAALSLAWDGERRRNIRARMTKRPADGV